MDEPSVIVKAQSFISKIKPLQIPVVVEAYLAEACAVVSVDNALGPDEAGMCMSQNGKHFICVNGNDSHERQRFTVCHELGHIILGLPTLHIDGFKINSYAKRDPNEIACDVFASELLLPLKHFKPRITNLEIGFDAIDEMAGVFEASTTCTGSRFATHNPGLCAFVISNKGKVRYAARSTPLRELNAFIKPGWDLPAESQSTAVRAGKRSEGATEIAADLWFQDWKRHGTLLEEARHLNTWDQTLTLLWFDEVDRDSHELVESSDEDESGLQELDGQLHFHKRVKRR